MRRIYSYVLRIDDGAAPNPFWGTCTLTICKPAIRRTARIGDWVLGTGSKNSRLKDGRKYDLSDSLVYAMKITDKLSLEQYDKFCAENLKEKIPSWFNKDWRRRLGDCLYDYSNSSEPVLRKGVHSDSDKDRDLSGNNSLLSTEFYYFGEEPRIIPNDLRQIIKRNQGHLRIEDAGLLSGFEEWIGKFEMNKIYAEPQLAFEFKVESSIKNLSKCLPKCTGEQQDKIKKEIC